MSHEIEIVNGQASMAYVGETPWHGLGVRLPDEVAPYQMMEAAGLDWAVEKQALVTAEGAAVTEKEALVRTSDNKVLDIVGKNWNPVQNEEAFNFFNDFCATGGMSMHTAGSLKGGQVVWALAKVNDSFELFGGDKVESYLLFSNPHKFGQAIDVRFTPIRVVCNNTLTFALSQGGTASFRMPHVRAFNEDVMEAAQEALGLSAQTMADFKNKAQFLAQKKAKHSNVLEFISEVYQPSLLEEFRQEMKQKEEGKLVGDIVPIKDRFNKYPALVVEALERQPGAELKSSKGTWWGALNAVTYVEDHLRESNDEGNNLHSAWFGAGANRKARALDLAVKYAEAA